MDQLVKQQPKLTNKGEESPFQGYGLTYSPYLTWHEKLQFGQSEGHKHEHLESPVGCRWFADAK